MTSSAAHDVILKNLCGRFRPLALTWLIKWRFDSYY